MDRPGLTAGAVVFVRRDGRRGARFFTKGLDTFGEIM
jgi:hypothetical protein